MWNSPFKLQSHLFIYGREHANRWSSIANSKLPWMLLFPLLVRICNESGKCANIHYVHKTHLMFLPCYPPVEVLLVGHILETINIFYQSFEGSAGCFEGSVDSSSSGTSISCEFMKFSTGRVASCVESKGCNSCCMRGVV